MFTQNQPIEKLTGWKRHLVLILPVLLIISGLLASCSVITTRAESAFPAPLPTGILVADQPALYILLLLGSILFGVILLALGVFLLFKVKNKLVGILVIAVGLVFSLLPVAVYLFLTVNVRVQG